VTKSRPGPMSYKSRKLKKSKFSRLKYELGRIKFALLERARMLSPKIRSNGESYESLFDNRVRGGGDQMFQKERVLKILERYDRMRNNPDARYLERAIADQVQREGFLRLCVFVCPKFNSRALFSGTPENYMPIESGPDLFEPRIAKIISLREDLIRAGLLTEINIIIGDNDAEEYIFPFMDLILDVNLYRQRQSIYRISFEQRCQRLFGRSRCLIWSLAESNVVADASSPKISTIELRKELNFLKWLFSNEGPYRGMLAFSEEVLIRMAQMKYGLYGAQGKFLEMLGGILLQTEGPGVWLERTSMLRSTGSPAIPAIYPWIRKDEKQE